MDCPQKRNYKCKANKYLGENCGAIRPKICPERKRRQLVMKLKAKLIEADNNPDVLGIGA